MAEELEQSAQEAVEPDAVAEVTAPEAAAEPTPAAEATPEPVAGPAAETATETATEPVIARRTVPVPGGSCNVRLGHGAIEMLGSSLAAVLGKPRHAVVIAAPCCDESLLADVRHQLSDAGFLAKVHTLAAAPIRTISQAEAVFHALANHGITTDDALVAVGNTDVLALGLFCAGCWQRGTTLALVATDPAAAIECIIDAPGLDLLADSTVEQPASDAADTTDTAAAASNDGSAALFLSDVLAPKTFPRLLICDLDRMDFADADAIERTRAYMAQSAFADSKNAFATLVDRSEVLGTDDVDTLGDQMLDTFRSRGRIACSNALAVRQSLEYGIPFARALQRLAPEVGFGAALAEGLRFESRLSAGEGTCEVETVLTQDALLVRLGLDELQVDVDAREFAKAIKEECFARSNRFMLVLPQDLGKVRLTSVSDELLEEHLSAWCAARKPAV